MNTVIAAAVRRPQPAMGQGRLRHRGVGEVRPARAWASHFPDSGPNKVRSGMEDGQCRNGVGKFSPEFRDEAVKMVTVGDRPVAQVARELGINPGTLGNWVAQYRKAHPVDEEPLSVSERARLRELERENRELKMRNEFLGKAADFFAQEYR